MKAETDPRLRFAELMGAFATRAGLPLIRGRVLGYLSMSQDPVSFSELAEALQISRGSVSESTKHLVDRQIITRLRIAGDRRDHFAVCDAARTDLVERLLEEHRTALHQLRDFRSEFPLSEVLTRRLDDIETFHSGMTRTLETLAKQP